MRNIKEELTWNNEHAIDLQKAVEELHGLNSQELDKLLRDSDKLIIQPNLEKGIFIQIDMERLAWSLPLHLIAKLISPVVDDMCLVYVLHGFRLLNSLSDLASRHSRLEQILLDEAKLSEQIMDLVFYMLIVLARPKQVGISLSLLHSALLACTLHLLSSYISSHRKNLTDVLLVHPKVDIFFDVAIDALHIDIRYFSMCNSSSLPVAERTATSFCENCEASLQFLQSLCQQKLFREHLLKNKELCKNGGVLSLVQAILKLNIPQYFKELPTIVAAVSRLKSKALSILLQLCESENISYLDDVAGTPKCMNLAKSVALEVLGLLKAAFVRRPENLSCFLDHNNPKGLVLLNSMRLADIFSDDSNFRSFIMTNITEVLAEILTRPQEEFLSSWCSADPPLIEEDATIDYDPFMAAGMVSISSASLTSMRVVETNTTRPLIPNFVTPVSHAQQRTSFLVKIIANLHCFVPNVCEEQERNLFLNKFVECLHKQELKILPRCSAGSDATIFQNLCSLLDHAVSLVPHLLNDEDVQLLSVFSSELRALISPDNNNDQDLHEKNLGDLFNGGHNSRGWPATNGVLDNHQGSQVRKDQATCLRRRADGTGLDPSDGSNMFDNREGGLCETTVVLEPKSNQFDVIGKIVHLSDAFTDLEQTKWKGTSRCLGDSNKDFCNAETSGSHLSSTKGKRSLYQLVHSGELQKVEDNVKESDHTGLVPESEKTEAIQAEEKQPRKRKRNIMNAKQINLIEKALLEEPEMQRKASLLQSWADKLSSHGSEVTASQLKNWLNNRKAKLARAAREARGMFEGENAFPDKASLSQYYDSPDSGSDESYIPPSQHKPKHGGIFTTVGGGEASYDSSTDHVNLSTQQSTQMMTSPSLRCEVGRIVTLLNGDGKDVGKGKVHQVKGGWGERILEEGKVCVVDVTELKIDREASIPYPSKSAGSTFNDAEAKNGAMRVAWDVNKISVLPQ